MNAEAPRANKEIATPEELETYIARFERITQNFHGGNEQGALGAPEMRKGLEREYARLTAAAQKFGVSTSRIDAAAVFLDNGTEEDVRKAA